MVCKGLRRRRAHSSVSRFSFVATMNVARASGSSDITMNT